MTKVSACALLLGQQCSCQVTCEYDGHSHNSAVIDVDPQVMIISRLVHEFRVDLQQACSLDDEESRMLLRRLQEGAGVKGAVELGEKSQEVRKRHAANQLDEIEDGDLPCNAAAGTVKDPKKQKPDK